jgi:hypothetical protein
VAMLEVNNPKTHIRTCCPYATEACRHKEPLWRKVSPVRWVVACHWIN